MRVTNEADAEILAYLSDAIRTPGRHAIPRDADLTGAILVDAAPDLVDAMKRIAEWLEHGSIAGDLTRDGCLALARAALDKADAR